jgi:hypothetical protein
MLASGMSAPAIACFIVDEKLRTVAITPFKSRSMPFETVRKVCQEWTLAGLNAMVDSSPNQPFRFLYMSGAASSKADDKNNSWTPKYMAQYSLMRVSVFLVDRP